MNPYDTIAAYYDLEHDTITADCELYRAMARSCGGPVLIAGVGTGRIARHLAEDGLEVFGFDSNARMLDICRAKLSQFSEVKLSIADLRDFELETEFPLVIVPFDVFSCLSTSEEQQWTLKQLRLHLQADGLMVLDVVNPYQLPDDSQSGMVRRRFHVASEVETVTAFDSVEVDSARQTMTMHLTYDTVRDGKVARETASVDLRWVYRFEIENLLTLASLKLDHAYGDYDLVGYETESPRLIVTARPA